MAFRYADSGSSGVKAGLWEVNGSVLRSTAKAIQFAGEGKSAWLPKSKIKIEERKDGSVDVAMPDWLAKEKGFA
jgi:hypothetical protein